MMSLATELVALDAVVVAGSLQKVRDILFGNVCESTSSEHRMHISLGHPITPDILR